MLVIGTDRSVTYDGAGIINLTVTGPRVTWSRGDGNTHNAELKFRESGADRVMDRVRSPSVALEFGEGPFRLPRLDDPDLKRC